MKRFIITAALLMFAAGSGSAEVTNIFTEGFNSDFSGYDGGWGWRIVGISTNGDIDGIEGDGYGLQNNARADTDGVANIIGLMSFNLGTVNAAGITYTFSGDFGWRYGTVAAASDLQFHNQTGFVIGGTVQSAIGFEGLNLGTDTTSGKLTTWTRSYTTTAEDVGKSIGWQVVMVDGDAVGTLTQVLTDDWFVTAGVPDPEPTPTNATLVVGVRADGLSYYYNPFNGANAYINNGAEVENDNEKVGSVIGALGYGGSFYTFGQITGGTNTSVLGEYRVNRMPLTNVYHTVSENIGGQNFTRNILTNSADAALVDFAYDGTDFWFLADDGAVYQNSSTNVLFTFSNTVAGVYHSLSVQGSKLAAGVTTDAGLSRVVVYNSGSMSVLWSQGGGAVTGGVTRVAGNEDSSLVFVSRADGFVYEVSSGGAGDYFGTGTQWGGTPVDAVLGLIDQTNSFLQMNSTGQIYCQDVAKANAVTALATLTGSEYVGLAVVQVLVLDPGYTEWSTNYGLTGGVDDDDDGDDLSNIYEYGLGGNPTNSADQGTLPVMTVSNGVVSYTHVMLTDPNADISYIVEQTPDLVNVSWSNANWSVVSTNGTVDASFDEVEYQIPEDNQLFFRLRITQL